MRRERSLEDLKAEMARYERRDAFRWRCAEAAIALYAAFCLFVAPALLSHVEHWSYAAAFYFSVQAMLGIGFGALSVSTEAMKWLVTFQIVLGAFSVAFVIARVIAAAATRIERREPGWSGVHVGAGLVAALLAMMLFAGVQEGWGAATSVYFAVSAFQTSGLQTPTIHTRGAPGTAFAPVFIALVCMVGVPLWGFSIGKLVETLLRANDERTLRRSRMARERAAEAALRRISKGGGDSVDRTEFLELWLLGAGLMSEATLAHVEDEFALLRPAGGRVAVSDLRWRVTFLDLVRTGVATPDDWESFRAAEATRVEGP